MKIKKVEVVPIKPKEGLVAFATVEVNDVFLSSIAVYKRLDGSGYRILYPTKRIGVCDMTICHPTTAELSREVEKAICTKAEEVLGL
ncbi:MAG TPA: hypothetical protein DCP92_24765 [Nitrospiraceae bacterium]|nr:hypothetical protein [Nitrospiraceae bacterium]